jgi:hypothetical protein
MPSSVLDLLSAAGADWHSSSRWGSRPVLEKPGLYLVTTSSDAEATEGSDVCHVSPRRIEELLARRPEMTVAGQTTDSSLLDGALRAMFPVGETILYVGLAGSSVAHRVGQYYSTRIGARAPHAGGWPLKMLADLHHLHVHVAAASDPGSAEEAALRAFMAGVTDRARSRLCDPALPLPFANLELTKGLRKRHGIAGAKEPRTSAITRTRRPAQSTVQVAPSPRKLPGLALPLNVTAADIASGQIRVTREPKQALALPGGKSTASLALRGESMTVSWDPRVGPDRERSGLLRIGKEAARRLIGDRTTLVIGRNEDGLLDLR